MIKDHNGTGSIATKLPGLVMSLRQARTKSPVSKLGSQISSTDRGGRAAPEIMDCNSFRAASTPSCSAFLAPCTWASRSQQELGWPAAPGPQMPSTYSGPANVLPNCSPLAVLETFDDADRAVERALFPHIHLLVEEEAGLLRTVTHFHGIAHILGTLSGLRTSAPLKSETRDAHTSRVNMVYARSSPEMLTSLGPDF